MTFDTKIRKKIIESMKDIIHVGRSFAIDVLVATQEINDSQNTKSLHSNCTHYVFFPKSHQEKIEAALVKRLGFKQVVADFLLEQPSRTLTISNNYPQFALTENGAWPQNILTKHFKPAYRRK